MGSDDNPQNTIVFIDQNTNSIFHPMQTLIRNLRIINCEHYML